MDMVSPEQAQAATVLLIDPMRLRRTVIAGLLEPWAASLQLTLKMLSDADLNDTGFRIVVISIGGESVAGPAFRQLIERLQHQRPDVPLVVLSDREEPDEILSALRAGIRGFIPTSSEPEILCQALTFIMGGGSFFPPAVLLRSSQEVADRFDAARRWVDGAEGSSRSDCLTTRQRQVLEFLRLGRSNKMIARQLGMSEATVKVHVRQIMRKLGASNRTHAALICATSGVGPEALRANETDHDCAR
jgi:DNA-binding NarL/FixJ family response regulator